MINDQPQLKTRSQTVKLEPTVKGVMINVAATGDQNEFDNDTVERVIQMHKQAVKRCNEEGIKIREFE